ncbi:hypothetical protein JTE90_022198 [Oedothorax gibbosus]|uniref:Piezo-type mechanosensitive ion channel component n=1 Tax=Oedothorax gibbosus TaxID=931172 RepID=A0AAV6VRT5_9ARAC|nr:hypothetical protein JTE90_022198 [Oedothorax gibbosus]
MDVKRVAIFGLFRIFLPLMLLIAVVFRFNFQSFLYLICLLINPLLSGPSPRYLKTVIGLSISFCLCHVIFQAVMLSIGDYGSILDYCDWKGRLYALFGLHRLDKIKITDAVRLAGLDFVVMFAAVGVFVAVEKLQKVPQPPEIANIDNQQDGDIIRRPVRRRKKRKSEVLFWTGETFVLLFLAGAGILHPSLTSSVYFLTFLLVCTWLSCNQKIGKKYLKSKVPLLLYCAVHFVCVYLYQVDYVQEYVPPDSLTARLLGLPDFVHQNCTEDARTLVFQDHSWAVYASPFVILGLYCLLSLIVRKQLISPPVDESKYEACMSRADSKQSSQYSQGSVRRRKSRRMTRGHPDDRTRVGRTSSVRKADEYELYYLSFDSTPLLDEDHTGRSYRTIDSGDAAARETLAVDPNGSIIWTSESDMPEIAIAPLEEEKANGAKSFSSKMKKIFTPLLSGLKLIAKGSYVATLIIMMTWSITYHSWLTFVLLLWSCILWMCPNSRYACLRSSPALVFYAECLLLLQYIFGLNLKDDELPTFSKNMAQIGLVKYGELSYQPLAIKMLYTLMFWITMRQFFEERQQSTDRNIAAAMKRHFSIVPSITSPNPYIRIVAETVSNLLTKYWIWIVAIMLMVISLGGRGVVVYRIVYMFLFLFFILMFQFSYQFWRRIMYGFWLTVIVFSMLVLIIIYTYQFQDFDLYWEKYLHVSKSMQQDLGLEIYDSDTGTLFVKLLTPTFFLIITIIQLHYFHKEFLLISDIHYRSSENVADTTQMTTATNIPDDSIETHITIEPEHEVERPKHLDLKSTPIRKGTDGMGSPSSDIATPITPKKDEADSNRAEREFQAVKICFENIFKEIAHGFTSVSEMLWRTLEIHIIKVVLLSTFMMAAYDVCAIHFVFVVFVVVALPLPSLQNFFSHCISIWTAILLLSKMIYQLNIVDYLSWETNCTNVVFRNTSDLPYPFNVTIDNHDWIGFKRTDYLANYCKGYIGLILVLTIQAVVKIRQEVNRIQQNALEPKTGVIFPDTTRATADDNFVECLKYLANYCFYKFGLEFCFVTIVACIGVRLDVFAFLSCAWLTTMFLLKRKTLARIWAFYVAYQCIVLTVQYIICLGLPPGLCVEYPWTETLVQGLRDWLFLPDFQSPPSTNKVVADFFQLLFACCQLFVFRIETSPIAGLYEGGSNKEIDFDRSEANPIPDFVTCTKTTLDMMKVFVFYAFYWISLAIVFQAGTSRINLFAMGYVVSCFYFLWNGNEFYLKSRKALLRMWNILLAYNVTVILLSCVLQLVGCTYFEMLLAKQCWLVQLLGIACQQTAHNVPKDDGKPSCRFEPNPKLIYDILCFAFLLIQRRLFSSYYFQHVVNEVKAQQVLSSRGAELIHEIQMKEVQEQQVNEKDIMERIKKKMDRIRAYQQKIRGGENMEPETHFQAIRSGDYYMFEDFSDDDIDLELSARHKRSMDEEDEDSAEVKEKGLNALLSKTIRGSLKLVEEPRKESGEVDDVEDSSQQSAIVSADRDGEPSSQKTSHKSPDPLTITSSGPTMTLSMPSSASSTSATSSKEDTVAAISPQDAKLVDEEPPKEETFVEKIKRWFEFFCEFMNSVLISTTAQLNTVSKDYRFVARQLSKEKKLLKERFIQNGSFNMEKAESEMKCRDFENIAGSSKDLKQVAVVMKKTNLDFLDSCELTCSQDILDPGSKKNHPTLMRFFIALYYAAISRSELLCYLVIIINQMKSASILSLPLPLFAFLWGTLSVPRPTKAFWITIITYTEAIVVLKYLFQFYFFPWNNLDPPPNNPFYPTVILGIQKGEGYASYDLAVLLVVFFHRFMLKSLGLWKDTEKSLIIPMLDDPQETVVVSERNGDLTKAPIPEIRREEETPENVDPDDPHEECSDGEGSETSLYEELPRVDVAKIVGTVLDPVKIFFYHLLYPEYRVTVDVYAFMFFCDFINFFIVVFGYWAFGTEGSEAVTSYFEENKVPIPFLIMLIAQFATIVTDRALYLRKYIVGKLIFQIITVFVVHMWMFFILPAMTARDFVSSNNLPPKMWYFIKCVYMLLSAHQIRSGYPTRILGNFFCKKYNYANLFLFKGYMIIPFLYELRSLMDWIWTDTSMNVSNWLKMEDIYANVFILKCTRRAEADYPTPRGAKRTALIKYGVGGFLLFFIILIIWFPLLLFALGNTVGRSNPPTSCTIELAITGYEPIFRTTALRHQIHRFNDNQWKQLEREVTSLGDPSTASFLTGYDKDNTVIVELSNNSTSVWAISPPSQSALVQELKGKNELKMILTWSFLRESDSQETDPEVRAENELDLSDPVLRQNLADALSVNTGNQSTVKGSSPESVMIKNIFPNYVKIPSKGRASVVKQFYPEGSTKKFFGKEPYRSLNVSMWTGDMLNTSDIPNSAGSHYVEWWEIRDDCYHGKPYSLEGIDDCNFLRMIAFSDKAFPTELSYISGYGIVGLYTTFVLVVSRLVRGFVAGTSFTIMFDDMPYVDRVLQLCLDIYLVRESVDTSTRPGGGRSGTEEDTGQMKLQEKDLTTVYLKDYENLYKASEMSYDKYS